MSWLPALWLCSMVLLAAWAARVHAAYEAALRPSRWLRFQERVRAGLAAEDFEPKRGEP